MDLPPTYCKLCKKLIDPRSSFALVVGHRDYQWPAHNVCAKDLRQAFKPGDK